MSEHTIESARRSIAHTSDGPVTSFELICRTIDLASSPVGASGCRRSHTCTEEVAAEALYAELKSRGFLLESHEDRVNGKLPLSEIPDDMDQLEAGALILERVEQRERAIVENAALPLLCPCEEGDCDPGYLLCPACIAADQ